MAEFSPWKMGGEVRPQHWQVSWERVELICESQPVQLLQSCAFKPLKRKEGSELNRQSCISTDRFYFTSVCENAVISPGVLLALWALRCPSAQGGEGGGGGHRGPIFWSLGGGW